ncbi:MAG: hypothetical protein CMB80_20610 [Flammeovirgaceae bacterium]|nr:hypothetical protein [Flammeovirgaceae bacterium]HCX20317.1 hypothetical protein [Cytophagales bacterium]|tara:strand:+ start:63 stop:620 length:558 start_codon:yes stop_codon:yes gene_type:complete
MIKFYFIVFFLISTSLISSGQEKVFRSSDSKIKVSKGDLIRIDTESAYVISQGQADALNQKLDELVKAGAINEDLKQVNLELLNKVKEVEKLVGKLLKEMKHDGEATEMDLQSIILQLDNGLATLKDNNQRLEDNNQQLQAKIDAMEDIIKKLRKEIRGIWWNGLTDKIVVGAGGLAVGILIMVL